MSGRDIVERERVGSERMDAGCGHGWRVVARAAKGADPIGDGEAHHLLGGKIQEDLVDCPDLRVVRNVDDTQAADLFAVHG
jgi:hypothetical protein